MITLIALTNSLVALKCGVLFPQRSLTFESLTPEQRNEALHLHGTGALRFVEDKTPETKVSGAQIETQEENYTENPDAEKAASFKRRPPLFLPPSRG